MSDREDGEVVEGEVRQSREEKYRDRRRRREVMSSPRSSKRRNRSASRSRSRSRWGGSRSREWRSERERSERRSRSRDRSYRDRNGRGRQELDRGGYSEKNSRRKYREVRERRDLGRINERDRYERGRREEREGGGYEKGDFRRGGRERNGREEVDRTYREDRAEKRKRATSPGRKENGVHAERERKSDDRTTDKGTEEKKVSEATPAVEEVENDESEEESSIHSGSEDSEERLIRERREKRQRLLEKLKRENKLDQTHSVLGQPQSSLVQSTSTGANEESNNLSAIPPSLQEVEGGAASEHSSLEDGDEADQGSRKLAEEESDGLPAANVNASSTKSEARQIRDGLLRMREMAQAEEVDEVEVTSKQKADTEPIFDMFADSPTDAKAEAILPSDIKGKTGAVNLDATDTEGYFVFRAGETLDDGRYVVLSAAGKGVFSTVLRARDETTHQEVAIKAIRNNDVMLRAGTKEVAILKKLQEADPTGKRHCVQFITSFQHLGHLCIVFEPLHVNLRELLRRYGYGKGISMQGVRLYARQILSALHLLQKCKVIHADIKPDNIMVNYSKTAVKLCDFGSAGSAEDECDITPYLVSRFYRAPEIVLGLPYGIPIDMWSVGCCLYELYTGKIAFPGRSNNEMLKLFQDLCGAVPNKLIRKGMFRDQHYDDTFRFLQRDIDPVTKAEVIHAVTVPQKPKKDLKEIMLAAAEPGERKLSILLADLLGKMFIVDPSRRISVANALKHEFFTADVS